MGLGYDPDKEIPDLSGKVILLTGGTSGVGKAAVLELAKHNPEHIYFTGRNQSAASAVIAQCPNDGSNITFLPCDFTSLESIRQAAEKFESTRLDIFIANAGITSAPPSLTKDGYEIQFGTNHVGNAALLLRLLPVMLRTAREVPGADVRFVAVTSLMFRSHPANGIDFDGLRTTQENLTFGGWARYGQSKLANILLARELGKRYRQITSLAVHPGAVNSEMVARSGFWDRLLIHITNPRGLLSPREGCFNTVWAATADVKEKLKHERAALFEPVGKANGGDGKCHDDDLSRKLWEWTVKEVGVDVE